MSKVVILLSDKRSGSTILQEELCRHKDIQHVKYSPHTYFETHHWLKSAVLLGRPDALFSGGRTYRGYGTRENAKAYLIETIQKNVPGWKTPELDEDLVFGGWEALCKQFATPVFFEKSPQILAQWSAIHLMLEWMERTEMEVKIIGLIRNPLAVQYSAHELFATEAEGRQFGWLNIQRNLLTLKSMLPPATFRIVRYEDMISEPVNVLCELCDFIGVARDHSIGSEVHTASREKWMANEEYTLQLDPAVQHIARAFGYKKTDLINPHQPSAEKIAAMKPTVGRHVLKWRTRLRDRVLRPLYLKFRAISGAKR